MIELSASDGHSLGAYKAEPSGAAKGGVVVIQEIFGVNGHIKNVCEEFAKNGYVAIAPALFDRVEKNLELGYGRAEPWKMPASLPTPRLPSTKHQNPARSASSAIALAAPCPGWARPSAPGWRLHLPFMAAASMHRKTLRRNVL